MTFDINALASDEGEFSEESAHEYMNQLVEMFAQSPEAQTLRDTDPNPGGWAHMMLDYALNHLGQTPPEMEPASLRTVVFELFPEKVSTPANRSPEIIRELRAFWNFLGREFGLKNAAACARILDDKAIPKLEKAMSDPANFGMAKSILMKGVERGFDMSTEEGIDEWIMTYNAETMAELEEPKRPSPFGALSSFFSRFSSPPPALPEDDAPYLPGSAQRKASKAKKAKRKMQKASRKKNRSKKK